MGANSATPKGSAAKVARGSRRRSRGVHTRQSQHTAINKLRRINRERRKAKHPPLTMHKAPDGTVAYTDGRRYWT